MRDTLCILRILTYLGAWPKKFKTIYFPGTEVVHGSNNEHRRDKKLFFYAIRAALKYFNKWGYVDKFRNKNNERILQIVMDSSK